MLSISELEAMATRCRAEICKMTHRAKAGHPGGSLSEIDILVALYGKYLNVNPEQPKWSDRDRFILSKDSLEVDVMIPRTSMKTDRVSVSLRRKWFRV